VKKATKFFVSKSIYLAIAPVAQPDRATDF
jgi:hypothetical protein